MPATQPAPGPVKTRSYTQLRLWSECGTRYELERVHRVSSRPGVWLPAGTAVHAAVEEYLKSRLSQAGGVQEAGQ